MCTTTVRFPARTPALMATPKSVERRRREERGSTVEAKSARELDAFLATTIAQDGAARAGAHACTESVRTTATTVAGLEGALAHGMYSLKFLVSVMPVAGRGKDRLPEGSDCTTIRAPWPRGQTGGAAQSATQANYTGVVHQTRRRNAENVAFIPSGTLAFLSTVLSYPQPKAFSATTAGSCTLLWITMWKISDEGANPGLVRGFGERQHSNRLGSHVGTGGGLR